MSPDWLDTGIQIVLIIQGLGEWLTGPMLFFSFLGSEQFFLLIAPAIYWCINSQVGLRLGVYLSLSAGVNSILKLIFHGPRPYWYDPRVVAMAGESSFGIPSGHSQNAVLVWGSLAASIGKRWLGLLAGVVILLIGLSRIFLGVHFPTDVLAGWLIGLLLLWLLIKIEPRVLAWLKRHNLGTQISSALVASMLIIFIAWLARQAIGNWSIPSEWIENATRAFPDEEPINPLALSGIVSNAAIIFGLASGAMWINSRGGFRVQGSGWHLLLRYLVGLLGVVVFWFGLGELLPDGEDMFPLFLRYLRYALVGFWVSGLAPVTFIRLHLAESLHK
jgi:membrane-associated phospholipid phosphatase